MSLQQDERRAVAEAARRAVPELPLVVGVTSATPRDSFDLAAHAAEIGAAAVMAMPPFPRVPSDGEIIAFYAALAEAAELPVIVQDSSPPVGTAMRPALVASIARDVAAVTHAKEETHNSTHKVGDLLAAMPDLKVVGGEGARYVISQHRRGAIGTMPASSLPEAHVMLWDALERGDDSTARASFAAMLPLVLMSDHLGPRLHKEVLVARGVIRMATIREQGVPQFDAIDRAEMLAWLAYLDDALAARRSEMARA